jgi:uncharacterized integral membrane protein (TIGR00697 family)
MRLDTLEDPWLSPTHQAQSLTREVLPETRLHGRREGTFLALVALFMIGVIVPIVLGASRVLDVGAVVTRLAPDYEPARPLWLAIGALAMPLAFFAVNLVCEVYGRRRANAMIWIGLVTTLAMVGLMRLSDQLASGQAGDAGIVAAVAFAAAYVVGHVVNVMVFDGMLQRAEGRRLWLRAIVATVVAQLIAWVVFAAAMYGVQSAIGGAGAADVDAVTALGAGGFAYCVAFGVVAVVPMIVLARALAVYLRVGKAEIERARDRTEMLGVSSVSSVSSGAGRPVRAVGSQPAPMPPAPPPAPAPARLVDRRDPKKSIQPFNSTEMRFFTEGEEAVEAAD